MSVHATPQATPGAPPPPLPPPYPEFAPEYCRDPAVLQMAHLGWLSQYFCYRLALEPQMSATLLSIFTTSISRSISGLSQAMLRQGIEPVSYTGPGALAELRVVAEGYKAVARGEAGTYYACAQKTPARRKVAQPSLAVQVAAPSPTQPRRAVPPLQPAAGTEAGATEVDGQAYVEQLIAGNAQFRAEDPGWAELNWTIPEVDGDAGAKRASPGSGGPGPPPENAAGLKTGGPGNLPPENAAGLKTGGPGGPGPRHPTAKRKLKPTRRR